VDGRFRDPLVGRDLLIGSLAGGLMWLSMLLGELVTQSMGDTPYIPRIDIWSTEPLRGLVPAVTAPFGIHAQTLLDIFMPITMFLIVRMLFRRTWAAIGVVTVLMVLLFTSGEGAPAHGWLLGIGLAITIFWVTFLRIGFLSLVVAVSLFDFLVQLPLSLDLSSWHSGPTILYLALMIGLAVYGFRTSLAGQPLLQDQLAVDGASGGP
jgi:hypothetical protein